MTPNRGRDGLRCLRSQARPALLAGVLLAVLPACAAHAQEGDFRSALMQARALVASGTPEQVSAAFRQAVEATGDPDERAQALFELARFLEARRLYREAAGAFEQIAALDPPSVLLPTALDHLGRVCLRFDLPRAANAYERLERLPGIDRGFVEGALWGQARAYQQMGEMPKAVAAAEKLLAQFPDGRFAGMANGLRVEAAIERKDLSAAKKIAESEAAREGGNAGLLLQVASEMRAAGQAAAALEILEAYASRAPDNLTAEEMILEIHQTQGTLGEYEKQLQQKAKAAATRETALRRLADLYDRMERPADALKALRELLTVRPKDPEILARAARSAMQAGEPETAIAYYMDALETNPDNARVRSELGDLYLSRGERDRALEQWKRATRYDPGNAFTVQMLGRTLHERGMYADAVAAYQEARKAQGDPAAMALELGEEYEALLLIDKAVDEYLLAMAPGQPSAGIARIRLEALAADKVVGPEVVRELEARRGEPHFPAPALVALGIAHLSSGDPVKAREALSDLGRDAGDGALVASTAAMFEEQARPEAALALYEAAAEMPVEAAVYGQIADRRASLLLERGQWRDALDVLEAAVATDMPVALADSLRLKLGDVLALRAGDWEAAADWYATVAAESEDRQHRLHAAWGLADCAFVAGRYEEARSAYKALAPEALTAEDGPPPVPFETVIGPMASAFDGLRQTGLDRPAGPDYAGYQLAEIDFRTGEMKRAVEGFRQVASRYPDSPFANDALARELLIKSEFTGESPMEGKYIEALCLADRGESEKAQRLLSLIADLGPDEPLADDARFLQARTEERYGQAANASGLYVSLREKFPDSPLWPEALLRAAELVARDERERDVALELFRTVMAELPDSPEAARAELGIDRLQRQ